MKISRNSWHYKLRHWGSSIRRYESPTLCHYFWWLTLKIVVAVGLAFFLGALGMVFIYSIIDFFKSPFFISNSIAVVTIVLMVVLPLLTILFIREKLGRPIKTPGSSILTEYIKAKKNKLCPLIEYCD